MNIIRWEPFEEVGTLRRSLDRMLDEVLTRGPGRDPAAPEWEPAVEMYETDQDVVVRAEMPNIDPKKVDVTVTDGALTLRGETRHEEEQKGRNYYRRELRAGAFTRTLPLPTEVKSAEAKATYKDGVLEVKIPKSERVRPTSVKVQVD
ncbi:MAG: Hsp20/alpha crystallin family protein [Bacillati bacterium ANGP1]|uniref:Hsp20/alpha crystallin family protein n=1 Tax=Candidatus Segetimicrobium genomatis TaxID=2569760 RepID=A0A537LCG6_9BACT|nr:MAG: Hsp20/alpha crystallin family protein [Terrabacteria group bacterium ANGP1]